MLQSHETLDIAQQLQELLSAIPPTATGAVRKVEMTTYKVGYFVGSLSSASINRVLSKALIRLAPEDMEFTEIPIGNLPLYSPDYDANYPPEATALKEAIAAVDAVCSSPPSTTARSLGH
jgi:hypothetical protein